MALMPLTQAAMQRLAAMLMAPAPSGNMSSGAMPAWVQNGVNTNRVMMPKPQLEAAVPPPPQQGPPPVFPPPAPTTNAIVGSESGINQNPPIPNPPLAAAPPPVTNASFGLMGSTPQAGPAVPPPGAATATPDVANMPSPVGTDPSMADPGIRQTVIDAMKARKMLPPQWAQNFGSLADQQGG